MLLSLSCQVVWRAPSSSSTSSKKDSAEPARDERLEESLPSGKPESERRLLETELAREEEGAAPKDDPRLSKVAESAGLCFAVATGMRAEESCEMRSLASLCLVGRELGLRFGGGSLSGLLSNSWSPAKRRCELRAISAPKRREDMLWASWREDLRSVATCGGRLEPPRRG